MNIKELIKTGESKTLEFKKSLQLKDEIGETVSAFSNTKGGTIIVGFDEDKDKIVGVGIGKNTVEELANYIKQHTDPHIFPQVMVEDENDKSIILIEIPESDEKPVLFKGRPYKRVGKSSHKISSAEIRKLALESRKVYWDEQICKDAGLDDIDEEKLRWFLRESRIQRGLDIPENTPVDEAFMRLNLLNDKKLTHAAVLLFGKEPHKFFTRPEVKCIRFKGTGVTGKMIDFRVVRGDLFEQLIETERFIYNNIAMAAWIEAGKLQRQEKWDYPPDAIREALANALCHREYETSSAAQVRIFDDRIEFWNPGKLPDGWTLETLTQKHESKPHNPLLLEHFFWVKYVEEVGTGTNKLVEWCKEWELPNTDFEFAGTSIVVTFWKFKLTDEYLITLELNERQMTAVEHIKKHKKITSREYAGLFRITDRMARNDIKELIDKKIIDKRGTSKKSTYYELKI